MTDLVWFYITPINTKAIAIVNDTRNQKYVVTTNEAEAATSKVIRVVFEDSLEPHRVLSFGRHLDNDIKCDPTGHIMAQRQCSFLFHNRSLIFRDHSGGQNSEISPLNVEESEKWIMDRVPRQRAIPEYGNWEITMGKATFLLQFPQDERWWERNLGERNALATKRVPDHLALTDPPPPSDWHYETRVQKPKVPEAKKHDPVVYHKLEQLGRGAVGSVDRILDLQSGRIMAVKIISVQGSEKDSKEKARKEVELIASLSHVGLSFLSYLGYLLDS